MNGDDVGRPDPQDATTAAEYMDALRRLKNWTGSSYRELEKRAASAGEILPRATLTAALSRPGLPRADLVAALVRACGGDAAEVARWVAARRRLAAAGPVETDSVDSGPVETAPVDSAAAVPAAGSASSGPAPLDESVAVLPDRPRPGPVARPARPRPTRRSVLVLLVTVGAVVATAGIVQQLTGTPVGGGGRSPDRSVQLGFTRNSGGGTPTPGAPSAPVPKGTTDSTRLTNPSSNPPVAGSRAPGTPAAALMTTTVTAVADTTVVRGVPEAANGHDWIVSSCGHDCARSSFDGFERKVLVSFDLSTVPAGRCPTAVVLRLWAKKALGAFNAYPIDGVWSEGTANWSNRPQRGAVLAQADGTDHPGWLTFRLPARIGVNGVHAFEIDGTDAHTGEFAAREDATIARPAELVVTHRGCG